MASFEILIGLKQAQFSGLETDHDQLFALQRMFVKELWDIPADATDPFKQFDALALAIIKKSPGIVCGFVGMTLYENNKTAFVDTAYVLPKYRNKKLAKKMVQLLGEQAKKNGMEFMSIYPLSKTVNLEKLLQKHGFTPASYGSHQGQFRKQI